MIQFNTVDYDREDTEVILRYFDTIVDVYKTNSRYANDSAPYVGGGGGGRSEMLTPLGGTHTQGDDGGTLFGTSWSTTNTVYNF